MSVGTHVWVTWRTKCITRGVLRIWVESAGGLVTMRLEGKVIGPWVEECKRAWHAVRAELGTKKLRIDLCGLTFVDENGTALLREIQRSCGAEILADSPLTKYFAERIAREAEPSENEGV